MSVEASELLGEEWTRWQGHLINGVFPLGRPLGHSAHSGVFLTKSGSAGQRPLAIKLIPAGHGQAELQLPRWARTSKLAHPHLLPLLESGDCLLDGLPYLYVVMEYADQTLAQLLQQRSLTADEAREMLRPILDALAFLHEQDLVHGSLKPANILVVGDQIKLASDTIRRTGGGTLGQGARSAYDPPEGQDHFSSAAGDIWGLGLTLIEALTRRSPPASSSQRTSVAIPTDLPEAFRDLVARSLSHRPQDRPGVQDLLAWSDGRPLKPVSSQVDSPGTWVRPDAVAPVAPVASATNFEVTTDTRQPVSTPAQQQPSTAWRPVTVIAAVILAVTLIGVSVFRTRHAPEALPAATTADLAAQTPADTQLATPQAPAVVPAPSAGRPTPGDALPGVLHEQIPAVAQSAARTIRGHVKVSVRAEMNAKGTVSRAVVEQGARSRYFQQLAVRSAKKWTFAPPQSGTSRVVRIDFDFTRDATTARAMPFVKGDENAAAAK